MVLQCIVQLILLWAASLTYCTTLVLSSHVSTQGLTAVLLCYYLLVSYYALLINFLLGGFQWEENPYMI